MAGHERRNQREQRPEVRRQVDVRVTENVCVALHPGGPECASPSLLVQVQCPDGVQFEAQSLRYVPCLIGARVISDHDRPGERHARREEPVEATDRPREHGRLVVDRHHDLDLWALVRLALDLRRSLPTE